MANPAYLQKKNGKYLWFALLGLGFQPDAALLGKTNTNHINLGPNMFDKPNKDAFYIVTHFLLDKLNQTRFNELYRHCWPVLDHKADAVFRKVTCAWLREIMDEIANAGSKVVASLFLSPGGHKFISLMLNLANHVMLQEMKTFTTDDSWVPEAAAMPASSLDMAEKRLNMTNSRFLKAAVDQDRFLHEYETRAQLLVKSMRDIRAEGAKYNELLKRHTSDSPPEGASVAEKTNRVRSLWSAIDEMLSTTKEEQCAVASVLKGDVDQYVLDGTDRVLKIPRTLLERVEQLPHQLSSGNVYESSQLNLLCVLELMHHSLQLLREEQCRVSHASRPQISPQHLQEKCQQMARALQSLHFIRQKISKEGIPEVRSSIRELEAEWDRKWMDTLKDTPLVSFLNEDPALGFLSPMAPLSFEPAADASYRSSVFSQYPAVLHEEKPAEGKSQESIHTSYSNLVPPLREISCPATAEKAASPVVSTEAKANTSLDWLFDEPPSPPLRTPSLPPPQASVRKMTHVHPTVTPMMTKSRILDMECDNLADQFAEAVTTSSKEGRVKGLDLESILGTLQGDPFSTRKQLTRTPESLIMDVRNYWRKALEESAEETGRSMLDVSIMGRLTPVDGPADVLSPAAPSHGMTPTVPSHNSLPGHTPGLSFQSPVTGSSAVQFSLDQETLPEMPSFDSTLSLSDEAIDMKSEDDGDDQHLLIPSLKMEAKHSPLSPRHHASPLQQALNHTAPSHGMTPTVPSHSSLPGHAPGLSFQSPVLWDTFTTQAPDSPSGTGSSVVQFSLDQETLPEMPSFDSTLSLSDETMDMKSEDDGDDQHLLIPSLKMEAKHSPLSPRHHASPLQQALNHGSFMESLKRTPNFLLSDHTVSTLDRDWLLKPAETVEAGDNVFSLDLDTLATPSPPKKEDYGLPKLITFSPIDDMKC